MRSIISTVTVTLSSYIIRLIMKKLFYILIPTVLFIFTCDKSPTESTIPAELPFDGTFPDPIFETVIRSTIDKFTGAITQKDLDSITRIDGDNIEFNSIDGIEYCKNLKTLSLRSCGLSYYGGIEDHGLRNIGSLEKLEYLNLSSNRISDIRFLKKLTNLKFLGLENTEIFDISVLSTIKELEELRISTPTNKLLGYLALDDLDSLKILYFEGITLYHELYNIIYQATYLESLSLVNSNLFNIRIVDNHSSLKKLNLSFNNIYDIGILEYFNNLSVLYLNNNSITDLKPIVDNPNFRRDGNYIPYLIINNNPLSEQSINEYIPALEARGVTVYF